MSSKREEERNEKIIRGLLKLPPNRKCINCNSLGPQYVCTNFWTFVCITCSGIHREFTHRVKSVSMAKFTSQEVEALQKGGNQRAREIYLSDWNSEQMRLPDSGNVSKIREFIKSVYVDKKYAGGKSSGKPPRDMQSTKNHEEHKRASSYHSFSQSPPYEDQYEERRYGKQPGMLTKKPGSDHGRYVGKMSSFIYSPGRQGEEVEDRFANETSGPRNSDYSNMSPPCQPDGQSPKSETGHTSPPFWQVRDVLIEDSKSPRSNPFNEAGVKKDIDVLPPSKRTLSSSSFGSLDSNSANLVDSNTSSLFDIVPETEQSSTTQNSAISSANGNLPVSTSVNTGSQDFFNLHVMQKQAAVPTPSTDLFSFFPEPQPITISAEKPPAHPFSESAGWATFDFPHHEVSASKTHNSPSMSYPVESTAKGVDNAMFINNSQWLSKQNGPHNASFLVDANNSSQPWNAFDEHITKAPPGTHVSAPGAIEEPFSVPKFPPIGIPENVQKKPETWNAFSDPIGDIPQATHVDAPTANENVFVPQLSTINLNTVYKTSVVAGKDAFLPLVVDDFAILGVPFDSLTRPSVPSSTLGLKDGPTLERTSTNPFDLLDDLDAQENNVFLDMSSLQTALPSSELPNNLPGDFLQAWYPPNPAVTFVPSVPQAGMTYIAGQLPGSPLRELHSQGPAAPISGNPFA